MAHLWWADEFGAWGVEPLGQARSGGKTAVLSGGVELIQGEADGTRWILLSKAAPAVRVNGLPLELGMRVLADRDEITLAEGSSAEVTRLYFSSESLAQIAALPDIEKPLFCPRCRKAIAPGSDAVRCPSCGVWHHQNAELECWTYAPHCALCPQPTPLEAGFQWAPEEL